MTRSTNTTPTLGAVVLAAGFGTRLAPLTNETPKPLLHVGGRPVMSHLLDRLQEVHGLRRVVVVVNDQHSSQWDQWHASLPEEPAVQVVSNGVRSEAERRGAVADMALAVDALATNGGALDRILVLAGDNLLDEPLTPHVQASIAIDQPIVLCRDLGADVPAGRFGEVTVDDRHVITRFREKPADPQSPYAATCSYVLPGNAAGLLREFLQAGDADSPGSFVAWLSAQRPVTARVLTGRYFDIGNHETLAAARTAYR